MSANDEVPSTLAGDHVLFAIDYLVQDPVLDGVYDPRWVTLTADGTLVLPERGTDAILGATETKLDHDGLKRAWSAILGSGVFADGNLRLPGFMEEKGPVTLDVFKVDDGTRSTRLTVASLGSEGVYPGDPPVPEGEMALRASATRLMTDLRAMGGKDPWVPPALLMWWRPELPADWDVTIVRWPVQLDLETAGHDVEHPIWRRCIRLDDEDAAAVARFAHSLPIDHLVEQGGVRYATVIRAIHADEIDRVACP